MSAWVWHGAEEAPQGGGTRREFVVEAEVRCAGRRRRFRCLALWDGGSFADPGSGEPIPGRGHDGMEAAVTRWAEVPLRNCGTEIQTLKKETT